MADQEQTDPSSNQCSTTGESASRDLVIEIEDAMAEQHDDQPTTEAIELRRRAVHSSNSGTLSSGITLIFVRRCKSFWLINENRSVEYYWTVFLVSEPESDTRIIYYPH